LEAAGLEVQAQVESGAESEAESAAEEEETAVAAMRGGQSVARRPCRRRCVRCRASVFLSFFASCISCMIYFDRLISMNRRVFHSSGSLHCLCADACFACRVSFAGVHCAQHQSAALEKKRLIDDPTKVYVSRPQLKEKIKNRS
jgi:hypothetical protein